MAQSFFLPLGTALLILICCSCSKQGINPTKATRIQSVAFDDPARGIDIIRTSDNGFLITGNTFSADNNRTSACLVKLDKNGGLEWKNEYGSEGKSQYGWSIVEMADGYQVLGFSVDSVKTRIFLMKTNFQGNLIWQKELGEAVKQIAWSMVKNDNNELICVGEESADGVKNNIRIFKLDANGGLIWEKIIRSGPRTERAFYICRTGDDEYAITGTSAIEEKVDDEVVVVKFNDSGRIIWRYLYKIDDLRDVGHAIKSEDGSIFVYGYTQTRWKNHNPIILTVDLDGLLISKKIVRDSISDIKIMNGIKGFADHQLFGFSREYGDEYAQICLLTVDEKGEVIGKERFGELGMNTGYSIKQESDMVFGTGAISLEGNPEKSEILFLRKNYIRP